jgi:hypothetical protein
MIKKAVYILAITLLATLYFQGKDVEADVKIEELEWSDLIPQGYNPDEVYEQYQKKYNVDELSDDDPLVKEMMQKLTELENSAPLNEALNGKIVKLPGFVVPLETDGQKSSEFLLVPYYGACIHVPPPPANQIVYVTTEDKKGASIRKMFDTVWVTGVIKATKSSTDLGDAGYTILASKVEPYEEN